MKSADLPKEKAFEPNESAFQPIVSSLAIKMLFAIHVTLFNLFLSVMGYLHNCFVYLCHYRASILANITNYPDFISKAYFTISHNSLSLILGRESHASLHGTKRRQ